MSDAICGSIDGVTKALNEVAKEVRLLRLAFEERVAIARPSPDLSTTDTGEQYKCPLCNGPMVKRVSRQGETFYGCRKYPECRGTRNSSGVSSQRTISRPTPSPSQATNDDQDIPF